MAINSVGDVFSERLPDLIQRAQLNAAALSPLHEIRHGVLLVSALLAFTNLDDLSAPVRFRRERLAELLGVALRTVDRRISALVGMGLIERLPQRKIGIDRWDVSSLRWTSTALSSLFCLNKPSCEISQKPAPCAPIMARRSFDLSFQERSIEKRKSGFQQKPDDKNPELLRGVPIDLRPIAMRYGLKRRQVVTLMARCKATKRRLQDVLEYSADMMDKRQLRGDKAMGWLLTLLSTDRDFGWVLRQKKADSVAANRQAKRKVLESKLAHAAAKTSTELPGIGVVVARVNGAVIARNHCGSEIAARDSDLSQVWVDMGWKDVRRLLKAASESTKSPMRTENLVPRVEAAPKPKSRDLAGQQEFLAAFKSLKSSRLSRAVV